MENQNKELLKVEHLKKYFNTPGGVLHAVDDVSFSIRAGETLGVVGESGCGKSTMGRAILRLHEPTSGKVYFDGNDILSYDKNKMKELRREMQIIFQDPFASLNPRMTVSEAIMEPLLIQKIYDKKDKEGLQKRVHELMNLVGLAERLTNSYPHELDLTYMFITHDLSVVKHFSNQIMVMYLGQMVEMAPTEMLFKNPVHPYTKALLSAIPIPDPDYPMERIMMKGEITSPIDPEPGCRFAKRCPYATEVCGSPDIHLTEVEPGHFVSCMRIGEFDK